MQDSKRREYIATLGDHYFLKTIPFYKELLVMLFSPNVVLVFDIDDCSVYGGDALTTWEHQKV